MSFSLSLTNPTVGQQILLHAQQYTFGLPLKDGRFSLTNTTDGTTLVKSREEISQLYLDGYAEHVDEPVTATFAAKRKLKNLDFANASDDDKKVVRRKQAYVEALTELGVATYQPSRYKEVIGIVAKEIGDTNKPSAGTLQRWRCDWRKSEGDPRVFLPQRARRGNRRMRWSPEVLALAANVAKEGLLTKKKHSVRKFARALALAIGEANKLREPEHQLNTPSESSIRRYCNRIDPFKFLAARTSWANAERTTKQYFGGVKTTRILERTEIDHTLLDLFVVDSKTNIILGRPWLTVIIDAHSRAILSFYLSFGPPSWIAVMEALKRAILPKGDLRKKYPEISNIWDCHGVMEMVITDNGKEFMSENFDDSMLALRINVQLCPPHEPWYKGKIERFMRTINQGLVHSLPGTTFGQQYRLPDYDPTKHATIDFHDLVKIIHMWVVDIYMQEYHRGIKTTPAAKWAEGAIENPPRLAPSRRELDVALGVVEERSLHHYGIEVNGLLFNCQELSQIRARLENPEKDKRQKKMARVKIKLLPNDISGIYLRDPLTDTYIWVPNTDLEYAEGKGWHQHKIIQAYAKATGQGKVDQEGLRIAERKIAREIKKAVKKGGGKRGNKKIARYENVGQEDYQSSPEAIAERAAVNDPVESSIDDADDESGASPLLKPTALPAAGDDWEVHTN